MDKHLNANDPPPPALPLVVCGQRAVAHDSAELASGHARLRRQWPHRDWRTVAAGDPQRLLAAALEHGAALPGDALVLLLAHGHLLLPEPAAQQLRACVAAGAPLALCPAGPRQPQAPQPNYHTVRGLERYCEALAQQPAPDEQERLQRLPDAPLILARMDALRALERGTPVPATWVGSCHAHDFGSYQQGARPEMLALIPAQARRVLDVGGGEGQFLRALKAERGCETHLSEYSRDACARAAAWVDHCWPGDFLAQTFAAPAGAAGQPGLPDGGAGAFDCVTLLDSLEHTAEPQQWLARIRQLLAPGGCLVGSVPNVGHWSVVADLLEGRWDYCPVGIHCITHLRFFTRRTLADLLAQEGFALELTLPVVVPCPPGWREHWLSTPGLQTGAAELDTQAFLFRARPA